MNVDLFKRFPFILLWHHLLEVRRKKAEAVGKKKRAAGRATRPFSSTARVRLFFSRGRKSPRLCSFLPLEMYKNIIRVFTCFPHHLPSISDTIDGNISMEQTGGPMMC